MTTQLEFGYNKGLPADVATAWGCRGFVNKGLLNVPYGHESGFGDWRLLADYIFMDKSGSCTDEADRLLTSGELTTKEDREVVLFEDERVVVKANPQRSNRFLYVCAYFKPQPAERTEGEPDFPTLRELLRFGGEG